MPAVPLREQGIENWTIFKLDPPKADDYAGQDDLFFYSSIVPHAWQATGRRFRSERFSRSETFVYLKLDGRDAAMEGFPDKGAIEDAINDVLLEPDLGMVCGTGTGYRYSYLDLALTDVDAAVPLITDVLRKGDIVRNSWLLFHDSELADEWIGVWPETPTPPGYPTE